MAQSGLLSLQGFPASSPWGCCCCSRCLPAGLLPGVPATRARLIHRWTGRPTGRLRDPPRRRPLGHPSPPDVIDALTFASPTPFSVWGVIAMWAVSPLAPAGRLSAAACALRTGAWPIQRLPVLYRHRQRRPRLLITAYHGNVLQGKRLCALVVAGEQGRPLFRAQGLAAGAAVSGHFR